MITAFAILHLFEFNTMVTREEFSQMYENFTKHNIKRLMFSEVWKRFKLVSEKKVMMTTNMYLF